jgi:translocation and assembly module TamA
MKVKADDRLNTRRGYRIYSEIRGANENLLSDTNYGQLRLGLKWIRGISDNTRLLLRGDFGTTNVAYLDKLPASQRFFAGGDNSVRGYAYEELGPTNELGEVIGGKNLIVGSVELEQRIAGNWSGAIFYDVGNAINSFGDELFAGAGFGVRWQSPVGPIRFDFAWALDKEQDQFRLHVVIGPDL